METFTRNTTVRCREHARNSREMAGNAESAEERAVLLELAHHWDALADILQKFGALRGDD
jgi:hypothetical protein